MPKPRGRSHTTLTETAQIVVKALEKIAGIKMIAPGKIATNTRRSGGRFITVVYTTAGFELIISGQSSQKVAVHTTRPAHEVVTALKQSKTVSHFSFKQRARKPGE